MNARTDATYLNLIASLTALSRVALSRYGLPGASTIALLSHSENTVFRIVHAHTGQQFAMRIHRPNYQTRHAIQSELDWMEALNASGINTPHVVPGVDGDRLQEVESQSIGTRLVALFEWVDGVFPDERELAPSMRRLGALSAQMHQHSRQWLRPSYFERQTWDSTDTIGERARWGRWRDMPDLSADRIAVLAETERLLHRRLDVFGRSPDRFGLIHADLRIANLLVDGERTTIIDFDDCGIGWFLHDMASAMSFIEHRTDLPQLMDAWAEGYVEHGSLSSAELEEFPTFVMQRRLQLLAWMASHSETDLARSFGSGWVAATADLGKAYLQTMG